MSAIRPSASPSPRHNLEASAEASLRVGLAVIYSADSRLLEATMLAVRDCRGLFDRTIVLRQSVGRRLPQKVELPEGVEWFETHSAQSAHRFAVDTLADCDLIMFAGEGIVFGPETVAAELRRFESDPSLAAALVVSVRTVDLSTYLTGPDRQDPHHLLQRKGRDDGGTGARYFLPCIFTIAPRRGADGRFEIFARRSEWAVYRYFLRECSGACMDAMATNFGSIVNLPDRRDSRGQGFEICEELNRFAGAFPEYEKAMMQDRRAMIFSQLRLIIRGHEVRARWLFLLGCLDSVRRQQALGRKMNRDIRNLG